MASTGNVFFEPNGYILESMNLEVFDRRPANGAGFVCFGQHCVASNDLVAQQVIAYTRGCLDALQITNGATHTQALKIKLGGSCETGRYFVKGALTLVDFFGTKTFGEHGEETPVLKADFLWFTPKYSFCLWV